MILTKMGRPKPVFKVHSPQTDANYLRQGIFETRKEAIARYSLPQPIVRVPVSS
jgi:hypothetical protein